MLHEEVEKYIKLSGDIKAWHSTSINRIGGYLDGYDRGLEILDKIRSEIVDMRSKKNCSCSDCIDIIDKYRGGE